MAIKIIKKPSLAIMCPVCNCEFSFDKEDTYAVGIDGLNMAVNCPICNARIVYHKVI